MDGLDKFTHEANEDILMEKDDEANSTFNTLNQGSQSQGNQQPAPKTPLTLS